MRFKLLVLNTALVLFQGCNLPIGEKAPRSTSPEAKLGFEPKCLSDVLPIMAKFVTGEAKPSEITNSWDCFANGLDLFYRKVKGRNSDEYSSEELARFFEDFFFDNLVLSDSLRLEIMRIKQVLVGGSENSLTRDEITGLIRFASIAKTASIEILPHMKLLSLNWKVNPRTNIESQIEDFNKTNLAFQKFIHTIGAQIQKNNARYELRYLVALLEEVARLYQKDWKIIADVKRLLPLIESLKASLVGGEGPIINGDEWTRFSLLVGRGYIQYLRHFYFIQNFPKAIAEYDILILGNAFDDLFSYLGDMVRNKPDKSLTKAQLKTAIISLRSLFPDLNITPIFIDQILLLKRLFLGGSTELILANEFDLGREKVTRLQNLGTRFYPYHLVYFFKWTVRSPMTDAQRRHLNAAINEFEMIGRDLGSLFESEYDLKNLSILIYEISRIFKWDNNERLSLNKIRKMLPAIIATKKVITASKSTIVKRSEWPLATRFLANTFGDYLQFWYGVKNGPTWRVSLKDYEILATRIETRLHSLLETHNFVIRQYHIDNIIDALREAELISPTTSLTAVKRLAHLMIRRLLWPQLLKRSGEEPLGVRKEHLETLKSAWDNFLTLHNWGLTYVARSQPTPRSLMKTLVSNSMPSLWRSRAEAIWIQPSFSLISDKTFKLSFSSATRNQVDLISFQNQNIIRVLSELIIKAYSSSSTEYDLQRDRYDRFFADIFPIFVDLKLIDVENKTFANSRFIEANLFTPSGNGDQVLNYAETVELLQLLFSGLQRNNFVLALVQKNCRAHRTIKQKIAYDLDCWLNQSRLSLPTVYPSLPEALTSYSNLSIKEFEKVWVDFLVGTGHKLNETLTIPVDDFSLVPHLVQYSEAIMNRFDLDQDQFLTRDEAMAAYPIFRQTLKSAVDIKSEKMLRGGYAYLLVHKKLPTSVGEKFGFITSWIHREDSWPIRVDRPGLADVLKAIAGFLENSKTQALEYQDLEKSLPPDHDWEVDTNN